MSGELSPSRNEKREEIKLILEYIKTFVTIMGVVAVVFAALQWREANLIANESAYQRMITEWRSHLEVFINRPEMRQYFYDRKNLSLDDPNRNMVLAVANIRLDAIDAVLTTAARRWDSTTITGWRRTFVRAFADSPTLCQEIRNHWGEYGLARGAATEGCALAAR